MAPTLKNVEVDAETATTAAATATDKQASGAADEAAANASDGGRGKRKKTQSFFLKNYTGVGEKRGSRKKKDAEDAPPPKKQKKATARTGGAPPVHEGDEPAHEDDDEDEDEDGGEDGGEDGDLVGGGDGGKAAARGGEEEGKGGGDKASTTAKPGEKSAAVDALVAAEEAAAEKETIASQVAAAKEVQQRGSKEVQQRIHATTKALTQSDLIDLSSATCSKVGEDAMVHLVNPPGNKTAPWWKYFKCYHRVHHPDKQGMARCNIPGCGVDIKADGSTAGLSRHLQGKHRAIYNSIVGGSTSGGTASGAGSGTAVGAASSRSNRPTTDASGILAHFPRKKDNKTIGRMFMDRAVLFAVEENVPFDTFGKPTFRAMFAPFHDDAEKIVKSVHRKSVREKVFQYGTFAKKATDIEAGAYPGSWTTDHWTGPNSESYSTTTRHYIDPVTWELRSCILDFEVFKGRTTGELIAQYQKRVIEERIPKKNVVMGITDMGKMGERLREDNYEHGYCTDHNLHLNAKPAFDDANIPGADGAMKVARSIIEYFESSSQATDKLLKIQPSLDAYEDQDRPVKTLQDVITRWWSTWRMLKRLRWLKPAIACLVASGEINCPTLTDDQWMVLHQIEIVLEPMAGFQRMLEGEYYVTGSLVAVAIYQIRKRFCAVIAYEDTEEPVRELTKILLKDLDQRYQPADDAGRVRYTGDVDVGFRKRYTGVHPNFFVASFLDPRVKPLLYTEEVDKDGDELESLMVEDQFKLLQKNVLELMVAEEMAEPVTESESGEKTTEETAATSKPVLKGVKAAMFGGLVRSDANKRKRNGSAGDRAAQIRQKCQAELALFIADEGLPLFASDGSYSDPLKWWEVNKSRYETLAKLAVKFLSIPGTSAPSERVWSRSAQVLSTKRASLDPEISSGIMFLKENMPFLAKHRAEATKGVEDALPLALTGIPAMIERAVGTRKVDIDVGEDLIGKEF